MENESKTTEGHVRFVQGGSDERIMVKSTDPASRIVLYKPRIPLKFAGIIVSAKGVETDILLMPGIHLLSSEIEIVLVPTEMIKESICVGLQEIANMEASLRINLSYEIKLENIARFYAKYGESIHSSSKSIKISLSADPSLINNYYIRDKTENVPAVGIEKPLLENIESALKNHVAQAGPLKVQSTTELLKVINPIVAKILTKGLEYATIDVGKCTLSIENPNLVSVKIPDGYSGLLFKKSKTGMDIIVLNDACKFDKRDAIILVHSEATREKLSIQTLTREGMEVLLKIEVMYKINIEGVPKVWTKYENLVKGQAQKIGEGNDFSAFSLSIDEIFQEKLRTKINEALSEVSIEVFKFRDAAFKTVKPKIENALRVSGEELSVELVDFLFDFETPTWFVELAKKEMELEIQKKALEAAQLQAGIKGMKLRGIIEEAERVHELKTKALPPAGKNQ